MAWTGTNGTARACLGAADAVLVGHQYGP